MHAEDLTLVTGATGNTGSTLLQELERRGAAVRAMVRSSNDAVRLPKTSATIVVGISTMLDLLRPRWRASRGLIWSRHRVRTRRRNRCDSRNLRQGRASVDS